MKLRRILLAVAGLIVLLVVAFLVANAHAIATTGDLGAMARSKCINDGYPAQNMMQIYSESDSGTFGFGGHATFEFAEIPTIGPDGKFKYQMAGPPVLRVELRRRMNLLGWEWEAVSVQQIPTEQSHGPHGTAVGNSTPQQQP